MSNTLLAGLHDREGAVHVPAGSWCVDTVALADRPPATNYATLAPGVNWIGRLNWGYGATGTIPHYRDYDEMAKRAAHYVSESSGCHRWIIGNETNHSQEWPGGQMITPAEYARCFLLCRQAIKRVQPDAEVIPAPVAPWNVEAGDWLVYFTEMLTMIGRDGFDAVALHSYIHKADPSLVNSTAKMDPPFQDRHFEFRAYQDALARVPQFARRLPAYLTEANPLDGWQARGIMPAMLDNVREWNSRADTQRVRCVVFYRYPDYDRWGMASKPDVIREFEQVAPQYPSPDIAPPARLKSGNTLFLPSVQGGGTPPPTDREWDERLTQRGVRVVTPELRPGQTYWRVKSARWYNVEEARRVGPDHHILIDTRGTNGERLTGVPVRVEWPGGRSTLTSEAKFGERWAANYPMSPSRNEFSVSVADGAFPSESVTGIGMGADLGGGFNPSIHTSTGVVFQMAIAPGVQPAPPQPSSPTNGERWVHPVGPDAPISQVFGVNPAVYARFGLDGHNGIDFAVVEGTPVYAVAAGTVAESGEMASYGRYVKLVHSWGETLYAHLSRALVRANAPVVAGQVIGLSGNTGFSTGPHLHFGMRRIPYTRGRPYDGYSDPMPYLREATAATAQADVHEMLPAAAREFGVPVALLASLVWAESSNRWWAESPAGAMGLCQIMPATWDEWAGRVGARDPWNSRDNLRVGAAYLAWCIRTAGDRRRGLAAYCWGTGNVLGGGTWPAEVREYVNKITHGADLLTAWGAE